jgi:hypothetical protein
MTVVDLMKEKLRRTPPPTQEEACAMACRWCIAALGPASEEHVPHLATGIAKGLFGDAYVNATPEKQKAWDDMCEQEYYKALGVAPLHRCERSDKPV